MEFPYAPADYPQRLDGRAAITGYLRDYTDHVGLRAITARTVHQTLDPEVVVVEFAVDGTAVRTGRPYRLRYISVITVHDREYLSLSSRRSAVVRPSLHTTPRCHRSAPGKVSGGDRYRDLVRRSFGPVPVQPFAMQGALNRVVRSLLAVPLLSRVIGRGLLTLYVVGRKSGKRYTVPMAYVQHEGALLLGSGFPWAKNLRNGEPVELRYQGQRRAADVRVVSDEDGVTEYYSVIVQHNPGFARINKIRIDRDGTANPDDLRDAWVAGARVMLLTLR